MPVYLVGLEGGIRGQRAALHEGQAWLGSDPAALLVLAPEVAAPRHARLDVSRQRITIAPDGGNVTVNDQPILGATALKPGDRIAIGEAVLQLEVIRTAPPPTPASATATTASAAPGVGVALPPPEPPKTRLLLGVVTTVAAIVAVALVLRFVPQRRSDPLAPMAAEVRRTVQAGTVWIRAAMAEGESEGSGFVSKSGYVFTNAHVVEGARSVRVVFDTGTPLVRSVAARLVRVGHPGEADDVALLAVPTGSVKPLRLTDAGKLTEGTPLAAFGFPLGSTVSTSEHGPQISIRSGTVTALRRDNAGRVSWVESDILAEVGNSGGPVVTHQGEVVGLATMLVGPNLRTARIVPANYLRRFGPQAVAP